MAFPQSWNRYRESFCNCPDVGVAIDYSRMEYPDGYFQRMQPAIAKAFQAMAALESGAIANPDEKRMVGHYWLRDASRAPNPAIRDEIETTLKGIKAFVKAVHEGRIKPQKAKLFENVLVIGIGGSALGPQFVSRALWTPEDKMKPFFFDNTDPDGMDVALQQIEKAGGLKKTLSIVISKSGGTKETRNGMLEAAAAYEAAGLEFAKHAVAVTGAGSELYQVAENEEWIATFPMWDWVGGRTSELAAVGLLPAALQGIAIDKMLAGAKAMDAATRVADARANPAAVLALMWYHAGGGRGQKDMVLLPYKDRLELFSKYLQQLVMESLGKKFDLEGKVVHQGIAVYGNKGSTDQHAYVQQLREGVNNFFVTFIEVLKDRDGKSMEVEPGITSGDYLNGFYQGTREALSEAGRENITVTVERVDPTTVGKLIALYERAVGFYGSLVNINAYHQPGVEAGKKAATAVIDLQRRVVEFLKKRKGQSFTSEELANALESPQHVGAVHIILRHLAANGRKVKATGNGGPFSTKYASR